MSLDALLGDPWEEDNPLGYRAVLAADECGELLAAGERALDAVRLAARFVPASLGGDFTHVDGLVQDMRAIFRRDPVLGIGHGVTSFIAAVPVWTAGDDGQRRWLARTLLEGDRAAAAFTELAHGADFTRMSLRADRSGGDFVITGAKQLINNIGRARAVTLYARTGEEQGSRAHSTLLLDLAHLSGYRITPRHHTAGLGATPLAGIEFTGARAPAGALLGEPGAGLETALRAFQVTRVALPAIMVGVLDTQLRLATRFAGERVLYGRPVADIPLARQTLAEAYTDLLICDALSSVAGRALHLLPGQAGVIAAASKFVVATMLEAAAYDLAVLLGARSYLREGTYGLFQKYQRDLSVTALAHASAAACLATIIPQLPRLARRSWLRAEPPGKELFTLGDPLPELDFGLLAADAKGADTLSAALGLIEDGRTREALLGVLAELRGQCVDLPPRERTATASAGTFALAERYCHLLAAAACAGVEAARRDAFSAAWLRLALSRLAVRLGIACPPPGDAVEVVFGELVHRHRDRRGFDFAARSLS